MMKKRERTLRAQAFEEDSYPDDVTESRCIEVRIPDADEFMAQLAGLMAIATKQYNYKNKDTERARKIAEAWRDAYIATQWEGCMNCTELIACLTPLFEEVIAKIDAIQAQNETIIETTNEIRTQAQNNRASLPPNIENATLSDVYGGVLALINQMHENNMKYYAEAELSAPDNAQEALSILTDIFPSLESGEYDEAFELGNAYFENQVTAYEADYPDFLEPAACDLYCRIIANAGVFEIDTWSAWLYSIETVAPDNAAAALFTRYSPFRQTFLNQIAAWLNQEESLQSYFKSLYQAYYAGTQDPQPVPPECDCVTAWEHEFDFTGSNARGWYLIPLADGATPVDFGVLGSDGWQAQYKTLNSPSTLGALVIGIDMPSSAIIDECDVYGSWHVTTIQGTVKDRFMKRADGTDTTFNETSPSTKGVSVTDGNYDFGLTGSPISIGNTFWVQLNYRRTFTNAPNDGFLVVSSIVLRGTGANPFE